jgi:hypothetical protein
MNTGNKIVVLQFSGAIRIVFPCLLFLITWIIFQVLHLQYTFKYRIFDIEKEGVNTPREQRVLHLV